MRQVLKSKAVYSDAAVGAVWDSIGDFVTQAEAEQAIAAAAAETRAVLGMWRGRAVYGWSGGKDSQALRVVMEAAGVRRAVLGIIPALEWVCYLNWVSVNAPAGLTVYKNPLDLGWLAANPGKMFPAKSSGGYFWTLQSARRAQHAYQAEHDPPVQVLGRRRADANHIPKGGIDTLGKGVTVYCPIRDWPHELVLAAVKYSGQSLPPIYDKPFGWTAGTGTWCGRRAQHGGTWQGVWSVEPERVAEAARFFPAAAEWT